MCRLDYLRLVVTCPVLVAPERGALSSNKHQYLDEVTVTCEEGYMYSARISTRMCQHNGAWSGEQADKCTREYLNLGHVCVGEQVEVYV